jgi:Domain of unknown function (DUF4350)
MRARTEALVGGLVLVVLVALGTLLGTWRGAGIREDRRASTFLTDPEGTRGLAQSLERLGLGVERWRRSLRQLPPDSGVPTAFALLDPTDPLSGIEVRLLRSWNDSAPTNALVLAGPGAVAAFPCYGFTLDWRDLDSLDVRPWGTSATQIWPRAAGVLAATRDTAVTDSSRIEDATTTTCQVPAVRRVDTLVVSTSGRVVALRLLRADGGGDVLLFADAAPFRNRALRESDAGPFILGLFVGRYRRAIFEEAHHGYAEGGSLAAATLEWTWRSPWGWAMWQLALVGLLALLAGGVRFGVPRRVVERRRRSPLEHVRALATALAAARGHDVAIRAIVEGLRRRLLPAGQHSRGDWREWLVHLGNQVQTPRAREATRTLLTLTRPGQSPEGVLRAANAVEDVWEELRP